MNKKWKKIIAPVIITAIVVLYCMVYGLSGILTIPSVFTIIIWILALAGIGVAVYVLIERIEEIRSGEEDDLSKY